MESQLAELERRLRAEAAEGERKLRAELAENATENERKLRADLRYSRYLDKKKRKRTRTRTRASLRPIGAGASPGAQCREFARRGEIAPRFWRGWGDILLWLEGNVHVKVALLLVLHWRCRDER